MNARQFSAVMRRLATEIPREAANVAAPEISDEIQRNFDYGRNEHRTKWAPLKESTKARRKYPGKPILTQTGRGRGSVRVRGLAKGGLSINVGVGYMLYHQSGTRFMAQRSFVPRDRIPSAWNEILFAHYERLTNRALSRA